MSKVKNTIIDCNRRLLKKGKKCNSIENHFVLQQTYALRTILIAIRSCTVTCAFKLLVHIFQTVPLFDFTEKFKINSCVLCIRVDI